MIIFEKFQEPITRIMDELEVPNSDYMYVVKPEIRKWCETQNIRYEIFYSWPRLLIFEFGNKENELLFRLNWL